MYYIATHRSPAGAPGGFYSTSMLHDVTSKAELAHLEARYDIVYRVDRTTAHRWVRNGGTHSTPLYWDPYDRRVRRARDESGRI